MQRRTMTPRTINALVFCLAVATLTACTSEQGPVPAPTERSATDSAALNTSAPTKETSRTFNGAGFDVAFSFDYPASWTVADDTLPDQEGGPFVISNEVGLAVASLFIQPQLTAYPCEGVCGDMAVSYLGEVQGKGMLGKNTYAVRTKAMDLSVREDLREKNEWKGNVRLIVGIEGNRSTVLKEDPFYFASGAGINVPSATSPVRPIIFSAYRHFETMAAATSYASSDEHAKIQSMLQSLNATASRAAN